jgi:O-antigen ligase
VGLLLTTIAGLVVWIVLWAIGVKSFDAFMITVAMIVIAAAFHVFAPVIPGNRPEEDSGTRWTPR